MQKAGGLSTIAVIADAGKGCICRAGSLLSRFVKCKTWNRSPVSDLDHGESEQARAEFRRTVTCAALSCYTSRMSPCSQKRRLFTTTVEQIAMPLLPGKLSSLFSPLPVSRLGVY